LGENTCPESAPEAHGAGSGAEHHAVAMLEVLSSGTVVVVEAGRWLHVLAVQAELAVELVHEVLAGGVQHRHFGRPVQALLGQRLGRVVRCLGRDGVRIPEHGEQHLRVGVHDFLSVVLEVLAGSEDEDRLGNESRRDRQVEEASEDGAGQRVVVVDHHEAGASDPIRPLVGQCGRRGLGLQVRLRGRELQGDGLRGRRRAGGRIDFGRGGLLRLVLEEAESVREQEGQGNRGEEQDRSTAGIGTLFHEITSPDWLRYSLRTKRY